jgi:hypothetical protein
MKLSTALQIYTLQQPQYSLLSWAYYAWTLGYSDTESVEMAKRQLNLNSV